MVTHADVVVENFAVGVMDRLGLGYKVLKQLNPSLVYASSTGYGQTGPYSSYPAFDPIIQAMSGIMSTTGFPDGPPLKAGPPIMDILGGIHLAAGVLAALYQRNRTGEGAFVETSLYDAAMGPLVTQISSYLAKGGTYTRSGNTPPDRAFSPYNCYPTKDGYVLLLTADDQRWRSLCQLMGREKLAQDPRFATNAARRQRAEEVDAIVSEWTTQHAKQEVMEQCGELDITCGAVKEVSELLTDPHIRSRGMLQEVEHPTVGKMAVLGSPWRLDGEHPPIDSPSPTLGQHNELVYKKLLGLSTAEIAELKEQEVI